MLFIYSNRNYIIFIVEIIFFFVTRYGFHASFDFYKLKFFYAFFSNLRTSVSGVSFVTESLLIIETSESVLALVDDCEKCHRINQSASRWHLLNLMMSKRNSLARLVIFTIVLNIHVLSHYICFLLKYFKLFNLNNHLYIYYRICSDKYTIRYIIIIITKHVNENKYVLVLC